MRVAAEANRFIKIHQSQAIKNAIGGKDDFSNMSPMQLVPSQSRVLETWD